MQSLVALDRTESTNNELSQAVKTNSAQYLAQLKKAITKEEIDWIIKKITPVNHTIIHKQTLKNIGQQVNGRSIQQVNGRSMVAIGAADDLRPASFGIWVKGLFGKASQEGGKLLHEHEYKSSSYGGIIGLDALINEKYIIGLAVSGVKNEVNYKDSKNNKTDIITTIATIYSGAHFENNFILNGSINFGKSDSKDNDSKTTIISDLLFGEILAGYQFKVNNGSIVPTIGVKILNISEPEKTNGIIKTKKSDSSFVEGIFGLKISKEFTVSKATIIPEIYGSLNYDFSDDQKNKKQILIESTEALIPFNESDQDKLTKNIGLGLRVKSGIIEFGGNFDAVFIDQYQGFTGSVKLKLSL